MLVKTSLLLTLFALPTAAVVLLGFFVKGMIPSLGSLPLPVEGDEALSYFILRTRVDNFALLIAFATNAILFLGLGGGVRVLQLLVWGEPVSVSYDFGQGIKGNWGFCLLSSLLFSAALFFFGFVTGCYLASGYHPALKGVCIAIAALVLFFVLGGLLFALPHGNLYRLSWFKTWRNSLIFFIAKLPRNVGVLLLVLLPPALLLIPNAVTMSVFATIFTVLYPAYALSLCILNANSMFDKYLNVGENSQIAGKGIVWEDEDPKSR